MKASITIDEVLELKRCKRYPEKIVRELFGEKTEATAHDIFTDVRLPDKDKVWLICFGGFLSETLAFEFTRFCVENAFHWSRRSESAIWAAEMTKVCLKYLRMEKQIKDTFSICWSASECASICEQKCLDPNSWASEEFSGKERAAQVEFLKNKITERIR